MSCCSISGMSCYSISGISWSSISGISCYSIFGIFCYSISGRSCYSISGISCYSISGKSRYSISGTWCYSISGISCYSISGMFCFTISGISCSSISGISCYSISGMSCYSISGMYSTGNLDNLHGFVSIAEQSLQDHNWPGSIYQVLCQTVNRRLVAPTNHEHGIFRPSKDFIKFSLNLQYLCVFVATVKLVYMYKDYRREQQIVVFIHRWSLCTGSIA